METATHKDYLMETTERLVRGEVPRTMSHEETTEKLLETVEAILRRELSERMAADISSAVFLAYQAGRKHNEQFGC